MCRFARRMTQQIHVYTNTRSDLPFLMVGEPYLVEHPSMRIVEHASLFLKEHYVERCHSPKTWLVMAHSLAMWLNFLKECPKECSWEDASRDHLIGYRD